MYLFASIYYRNKNIYFNLKFIHMVFSHFFRYSKLKTHSLSLDLYIRFSIYACIVISNLISSTSKQIYYTQTLFKQIDGFSRTPAFPEHSR